MQCPLCTMTARKRKGLLDHIEVAHGKEAAEKMMTVWEKLAAREWSATTGTKQPWQCPLCTMTGRKRKGLLTHLEMVHNKEAIEKLMGAGEGA